MFVKIVGVVGRLRKLMLLLLLLQQRLTKSKFSTILLLVDVRLGGRIEVEGLDPAGDPGVVLQAPGVRGVAIGALHLRDLDVPEARPRGPRGQGKGQGGSVRSLVAHVDVH